MNYITKNLNSNTAPQQSLKVDINYNQIIDLFLNNRETIDEFLMATNDKHVNNLWSDLFKNKNFNFPINKHAEIYILNNKNNINKIFNYINFRYKFYLCGKEKIDLGYPPYLLIEPVSTCNLRCPFCFQTDKTFTRKPYMGIMEFDLFKKVVDEADFLGIGAITLASRGEPTLHKNLKDMLRYLSTKKNIFEIKLNTNATFLNEQLAHEIFKNNLSQVVISADHYEKEFFEKLRKNSIFEKIVKNVDMLFKIRKEYENSITEIRVSGVNFYGNLDKNKFHDFWIKRSDHVSVGDAIERWDTYNNLEHPEIDSPCENLWDRMYVWFDGKVNPCDADYKSYLSYGNMYESSIKELWNNQMIKETRETHLRKERGKINPCNKCGVQHS